MTFADRPLQTFLQNCVQSYHLAKFIPTDPVEFVHRYPDRRDQEVTAVFAAQLAYGNVTQIKRSVAEVLVRMHSVSPSPQAWIQGFPRKRQASLAAFSTFVHRFNSGEAMVGLAELMARSYKVYGSLEGHFFHHFGSRSRSLEVALNLLLTDWREWANELSYPRSSGLFFFLSSPDQGSACKRWCMFLRWALRKDEIDPGFWSEHEFARAAREQLVIPMDTHVGEISRFVGLTDRKSNDWKAALQVTKRLRDVNPTDPLLYDFSLARLGIVKGCKKKFVQTICPSCKVHSVCILANKKSGTPKRKLSR